MNEVPDKERIPTPPPVPAKATRGGENEPAQWGTLRLSANSLRVWTEPMLKALARGNEGRKWHTLSDKVWSTRNLELALQAVVTKGGAPGVDGQTTEAVATRAAEEVATIQRLLTEGRYEPRAVRRVWIEKLGSREKRPLGIPTVRDRVVQSALLHILEPIFERDFAESSYGFRPGRSAQSRRAGMAEVERNLKAGCNWVVDADLKGYFDSIPQEQLLARVGEKVADGRVLDLLKKFLGQGVMETGRAWEPTVSGTPQGAVISPLLANVYLDPLDHEMVRNERRMTRYADDFVILCQSEAEAQAALAEVRQWVNEAGLTLHPEKTKIVNLAAGASFEFLGWHFERGYKWPREKSVKKFKETVRKRTVRSSGEGMGKMIESLNRVIRGWGNYFRGGVRNVPERLEQWIRMRLRSVLRKQAGRKGRGEGYDHNEYPNAWFTARGLIPLTAITHGSR